MTGKPKRVRLLLAITLALSASQVTSSVNAQEQACSPPDRSTKRLVLVTAASMGSVEGTVRLFRRDSADTPWVEAAPAKKAVLGRGGMGWGWDQQSLAAKGEPEKKEGDGRTPAGIFTFERAFGFGKSGPGAGYLHLAGGKTYCVDDPGSPFYNRIVDRTEAGQHTSGEDMGTISLYRFGLQISFPTSAAKRGGSCIFLHVWRSPTSPTSGCVALREADVKEVQEWATKEPTVIAIVPKRALGALAACFPGLS